MTKTMIKKFKSWIIHRLGGVTINEIEQKDSNSFDMGIYVTLSERLCPQSERATSRRVVPTHVCSYR